MSDASRQHFTTLLSNEVLSAVERLRLNASRRLTNRGVGEHLAGKNGASIEYADYRDYAEGDDVRFVDWNIFARLRRPYMKVYHHEEELHVALLVDASLSMNYEDKLARARQLAAAFGVMGLLGGERVSCGVFNAAGGEVSRMTPCRGRASMQRLFRFLEDIEAGGDMPVDIGIERFLASHRGRGVAIVLSDFLTFGDVGRAVNRLAGGGLEVFGVQVLGPSELQPELNDDVRLVDAETQQTLDVTSAGELLHLYEEYRLAFEEQLASLCRRHAGRFLQISSEDDLRWVLFDLMRRKGWVRS